MDDPIEPEVQAGLGEPTTPRPMRDRRRDARMVVIGVCGVLLVWFALVNLRQVTIRFWVVEARSSLIVVIAISVLLGAVVAALLGRSRRRRRSDG